MTSKETELVSQVNASSKIRLLGVVNPVNPNILKNTKENTVEGKPPENDPASPPEFMLSEGSFLQTPNTHPETQRQKPNTTTKDRGGADKLPGNSDKNEAKKHLKAQVEAAFIEFWEYYPNKDGEAGARRAFYKLFPASRKPEANAATLKRVQDRLATMLDRIEIGEKNLKYVQQAKNWLVNEDFGHD